MKLSVSFSLTIPLHALPSSIYLRIDNFLSFGLFLSHCCKRHQMESTYKQTYRKNA